MARFRFYLTPFTDLGEYDEEFEITDEVDSQGLGQLKHTLDNTEYDIGIFKNSGINLTLVNSDGRFAEVGGPNTVFKFRRSNSLVRVTYQSAESDSLCGFVVCGEAQLSEETELFSGLLNDDALKMDADSQTLSFKVLGRESILSEIEAPFDDIENGDLFSEVMLKCLDQFGITRLLTVDPSNITCGLDLAIDDKTDFLNKTVIEVLKEILFLSNSVLFITDDAIIISPRAPSSDLKFTFFGQGAMSGSENIVDISDFRSGLNRTFNYWTWTNTSLLSTTADSVLQNGIKKKEINSSVITAEAKRQLILDTLNLEFATPKREMILKAPLDYETLALWLLDRVAVDNPNVAIAAGGNLPLWDKAKWDIDRFPHEILPLTIDSALRFKILSRSIDPTNHEVSFELREL